jgi:uncharacterized protein with FMN-binding domain
MKRVIASLLGTVAGLAGLLSFKAHGHALGATGPLPSAALPGSSTSSPTASASAAPHKQRASSPKPASSTAQASRSIDGAAVDTRYGIVQVQVQVTGTRIDNVSFLQLTAFDEQSQQINSYAAPQLLQETLDAQSAHIDAVSGATYTSAGFVQSLQSALDQAGIR